MDDAALSTMMQAYAEDAVDHARRFGVSLDYTDDSIKALEGLLDRHHRELPRGIMRLFKRGPSEETMATVSKMYGGYIGEVFRRNHGGDWTVQTNVPGAEGPVITLRVREGDMWFPPAKVLKRIVNGEEDSVWFYYQVIVSRANESGL